jgi:hypothetical protein
VKSVVMAMAAKARRLAVCAWCRGRAHQSAKTHGGGTRTKGEHAQKAPARNGTGNNAVKFLFLGAQIPALVDLVEGQAAAGCLPRQSPVVLAGILAREWHLCRMACHDTG